MSAKFYRLLTYNLNRIYFRKERIFRFFFSTIFNVVLTRTLLNKLLKFSLIFFIVILYFSLFQLLLLLKFLNFTYHNFFYLMYRTLYWNSGFSLQNKICLIIELALLKRFVFTICRCYKIKCENKLSAKEIVA